MPFLHIAHSHKWKVYAADVEQVKKHWKALAKIVNELCSDAE